MRKPAGPTFERLQRNSTDLAVEAVPVSGRKGDTRPVECGANTGEKSALINN